MVPPHVVRHRWFYALLVKVVNTQHLKCCDLKRSYQFKSGIGHNINFYILNIMGYIYCITNQINNKQYIGKTLSTVEKRFKEHCRDCKKDKLCNRPLYSAMRKYGIENFSVETLEEVNNPSDLAIREQFWISKRKTYGKTGYNATIGGDGKSYLNYDLIKEEFFLGVNIKEIASKYNIDSKTVRKIRKLYNIPIIYKGRKVYQYNKNNELIKIHNSIRQAFKDILRDNPILSNSSGHRHIIECCQGKIKTAYGYVWKYENQQTG